MTETVELEALPEDGGFERYWLSLALQAGEMGVWHWNLKDDAVHFDATQVALTGLGTDGGKVVSDDFLGRIHPEDRIDVDHAIKTAILTASNYAAEFRYNHPDGRMIWLAGRGDIVRGEDGTALYLTGVNWDISEKKEAEERARMVTQEMAHRIKNLIAVISGISRMTAQSSKDLAEYQENFGNRLAALGSLNEFMIGDAERLPTVEHLVEDTLYGILSAERIDLHIDPFSVNEHAAQTLVLAMNELATNAVKYGALQDDDGHIRVSIKHDKQADSFTFEWHESRSRPIESRSDRRGFGSQVLLGLTRATAGGNPGYEWHENGLTYCCVWKASDMSA
jgi:PAS domain S-box-containing protein